MSKVIGIYHKDCTDGTTAAAVVLKKFPQALLFPLAHSYKKEDLEPILDLIDHDTICYTVDCGLGVKELLEKGVKVTTLDHHISVKENLEAIAHENKDYTFVFDNDKSGATLVWSYFFPDQRQPELLKYVEDNDLWRQRYGGNTIDVVNYISIFRNDPETVLKLMESDLSLIKSKGEIISQYTDRQITDQMSFQPIYIKINERMVPILNLTAYQSVIAHKFSEKLDRAVGFFFITGDTVRLSFRSVDHQIPTALDLASILGGGGHKNAAGGILIPLKEFLKMIVLQ